MLDKKMGKVAKGEKKNNKKKKKRKEKNNKKKYSFMFLRFYVEREALMIKDGKFMCFNGISCLKYHFSECSTVFGLNHFFYSFLPHLNPSPITTRK
jgi:hypothetical protein